MNHIFPYGDDLLAASVDLRGAVANRLKKIPECKVVQDGDDGLTAVFGKCDLKAVATLIRPRQRRRLSAQHMQKLIAAGTDALRRFNAGSAAALDVDAADNAPSGVASPTAA